MNFHSKKILILMIVCNLGALAGYYFLFEHIVNQTKTAGTLTSTIDLGQQTNGRLNALRTAVKNADGKVLQLPTFLLASSSEVSFIDQMETLAKSSGLGVKTNNVASVAGVADVTINFQIQTETTGSWNNTLYFLSQIENLPYNIYVRGFSLQKASAGAASSATWTATFDISVAESK